MKPSRKKKKTGLLTIPFFQITIQIPIDLKIFFWKLLESKVGRWKKRCQPERRTQVMRANSLFWRTSSFGHCSTILGSCVKMKHLLRQPKKVLFNQYTVTKLLMQ